MSNRTTALDVWLYGKRLAQLSQPNPGRMHYRLEFTEEALDTYGEGRRILSLALPVSRRPITDAVGVHLPVTNFLDGLLPEGNLRQQLASTLKVPTTDLMPLLRAVGGDCAGAVQFLPTAADRPSPRVQPLTAEQVADMVTGLPTYNLPQGAVPQASLAGLQDKLLVVDLGGGRWGLPENGAASTHIIKPEPLHGAIPHLIDAEQWSLRTAAAAELPAARSRIEQFGPRKAIVITRYDRDHAGNRIHQEDLCQVLGLPPGSKYESAAEAQKLGSRLSRVVARAAAQAENDPSELRTALLSAVVFNVVSGNGDAHSKNYSILIGRRGEVRMAPLYDTAPIMYMNDRFRSSGHVINGKTAIPAIDAEDLVAEARTWGLPTRLAQRAVSATVAATREAIDTTPVPSGLEQMRANLDAFWTRKSWGAFAGVTPPTSKPPRT